MKMPVLAERKKMTKEELEAIAPFILEMRRREQTQEAELLQHIQNIDQKDDFKVEEAEEEDHFQRQEMIKIFEDHLNTVRQHIDEQETNLTNLQQEKLDLFENFKKSLQIKHKQQLEQQKQQQPK